MRYRENARVAAMATRVRPIPTMRTPTCVDGPSTRKNCSCVTCHLEKEINLGVSTTFVGEREGKREEKAYWLSVQGNCEEFLTYHWPRL